MFVEKDITMVSNGNGMWRRQSIRTAAVFGGVATGVMLFEARRHLLDLDGA